MMMMINGGDVQYNDNDDDLQYDSNNLDDVNNLSMSSFVSRSHERWQEMLSVYEGLYCARRSWKLFFEIINI